VPVTVIYKVLGGPLSPLQATLNVIPAYTWYAAPSGALTFVNKRTADYMALENPCRKRQGIVIGQLKDSE
jgi:hypothetical protein